MYINILGYNVEKKKVKNINLRINQKTGDIYISAPLNLDNYYIEQFIKSKKKWIDYHLNRVKENLKILNQENLTDGSKFKFLDKYYNFKILNDLNKSEYVKLIDGDIIVNIHKVEKEKIKVLVDLFLFNNSKKIIEPLFYKWLKIMDENVERLILKKIKGKWGYCNTFKKQIALNTDLVKRSMFEIEYVIIHEIAHLKHPNHSENFYQHVKKYMPNFKEAENLLKKH